MARHGLKRPMARGRSTSATSSRRQRLRDQMSRMDAKMKAKKEEEAKKAAAAEAAAVEAAAGEAKG